MTWLGDHIGAGTSDLHFHPSSRVPAAYWKYLDYFNASESMGVITSVGKTERPCKMSDGIMEKFS